MDKRLLALLWGVWAIAALVILGPPIMTLVSIVLIQTEGTGQVKVDPPGAIALVWTGALAVILAVSGRILYMRSRGIGPPTDAPQNAAKIPPEDQL